MPTLADIELAKPRCSRTSLRAAWVLAGPGRLMRAHLADGLRTGQPRTTTPTRLRGGQFHGLPARYRLNPPVEPGARRR
jgi:hypothetical protein